MTTISEIMTRDVQVVRPEASVQEAAQCMKDLDVGALPVCDGRKLLGMITDRDIVIRSSAIGLAPASARVSDVMSAAVRWCTEDQDSRTVLEDMGRAQVRRLPVINARKELVGIVSLGDLATRQDDEPTGPTLRQVSEPAATPAPGSRA